MQSEKAWMLFQVSEARLRKEQAWMLATVVADPAAINKKKERGVTSFFFYRGRIRSERTICVALAQRQVECRVKKLGCFFR